jgi:hypothetical protein
MDSLTSAATAVIDVLHSMDQLSEQLPESERSQLERVRRRSLSAVAHMLTTNCELAGEALAAEEIDPHQIADADALASFVDRLAGHLGRITTIYDIAVQILRAVTTEAELERAAIAKGRGSPAVAQGAPARLDRPRRGRAARREAVRSRHRCRPPTRRMTHM